MLILCVQSNKMLSCGATVEDLGAIIQYSTGKQNLKHIYRQYVILSLRKNKRGIFFLETYL